MSHVSKMLARGPIGPPFDPLTIPGLKIWHTTPIMGLNNDDPIITWPDSSGNGYHAIPQGGSPANMVYKTNFVNGHDVVYVNGAVRVTETASQVDISAGFTIYMVCQALFGVDYFGLWYTQHTGYDYGYLGASVAWCGGVGTPSTGSGVGGVVPTNWNIINGVYTSTDITCGVNGADGTPGTGVFTYPPDTWSLFLPGPVSPLQGYCAEVILASPPPTGVHTAIINYLKGRFNIA